MAGMRSVLRPVAALFAASLAQGFLAPLAQGQSVAGVEHDPWQTSREQQAAGRWRQTGTGGWVLDGGYFAATGPAPQTVRRDLVRQPAPILDDHISLTAGTAGDFFASLGVTAEPVKFVGAEFLARF